MEEMNKKYDLIYNIFKDYQSKMKEFAVTTFLRLDIHQLVVASEKFAKDAKRLGSKLADAEKISPYLKLVAVINDFKESLPLMEQLG